MNGGTFSWEKFMCVYYAYRWSTNLNVTIFFLFLIHIFFCVSLLLLKSSFICSILFPLAFVPSQCAMTNLTNNKEKKRVETHGKFTQNNVIVGTRQESSHSMVLMFREIKR